MRVAISSIVLAAALAAAPASAQSFLGQWSATAKIPDGPEGHELLTVTRTGDTYSVVAKLVGDIPPGAPEAGPGYDIVLDGDNFSYKRKVEVDSGPIVIVYAGTVSGDTFTGTVDIGGFISAPYTGVRAIPLPAPAGQ